MLLIFPKINSIYLKKTKIEIFTIMVNIKSNFDFFGLDLYLSILDE